MKFIDWIEKQNWTCRPFSKRDFYRTVIGIFFILTSFLYFMIGIKSKHWAVITFMICGLTIAGTGSVLGYLSISVDEY